MHPAVTAGGGGRVSDEALAARVRCDPEVFTEVYDRYFRAIYLYVAARLGTGPAEDIAAETFAVAFGQRDRFDPGRGRSAPLVVRDRHQSGRPLPADRGSSLPGAGTGAGRAQRG